MYKFGLAIAAFLVASFFAFVVLGFAFIADWPGHWIPAVIVGLIGAAAFCMSWGDFLEEMREK